MCKALNVHALKQQRNEGPKQLYQIILKGSNFHIGVVSFAPQ